MKHDLKP